jgi:ABC-type glycerol-3-phosphate transport system substrate-binding protein
MIRLKKMLFGRSILPIFEAANPVIKIDMTVESWDTVYTKWDQMMQSGKLPILATIVPSLR